MSRSSSGQDIRFSVWSHRFESDTGYQSVWWVREWYNVPAVNRRTRKGVGSIPTSLANSECNAVASVRALGARSRGFESHLSDHFFSRCLGPRRRGSQWVVTWVQLPPPRPQILDESNGNPAISVSGFFSIIYRENPLNTPVLFLSP